MKQVLLVFIGAIVAFLAFLLLNLFMPYQWALVLSVIVFVLIVLQ